MPLSTILETPYAEELDEELWKEDEEFGDDEELNLDEYDEQLEEEEEEEI